MINLSKWKASLHAGLKLRCTYRWYWDTSNSKPKPVAGFEPCEITEVKTVAAIMTAGETKRSWMRYPKAADLKASDVGFELYFPDTDKEGVNRGKLMSRYEYVTE